MEHISTLVGTLALCFIFGTSVNVCKGQPYKGTLKLHENLNLTWRINSTKGTIRFIVNASIHEQNGWFLIGLAPQNTSSKISLKHVTGYGFVVWKEHKIGKSAWRKTDVSVVKGKLKKSSHSHYHLGSSSYKKQLLSVLLWRSLKGDQDTVEIKHGSPLTVFGSHGNDGKNKWKNLMNQFNKGSVNDIFVAIGNVDFFKTGPPQTKKAKDANTMDYSAIAERHWVGIVIGISAFLTIIITCSVYCITKKKKAEFKRVVSMPFHKNTDYDDEAKVAFLQSEET